MRTSLVTREEMIEAIEQHTACISTRDIPGVIANYFMITKQLYRRKDKNAVHRILLTDIREYLLEQGHLNYATVAAEARKEAHRMKASKPDVVVTKPLTATTPAPAMDAIPNTGDTIDSQTLLKMVNEARKLCGEPLVRNNKFIEKVVDELEGETYTKSVGRKNGANIDIITMTFKQALRVAARESKAVRRSLHTMIQALEPINVENQPDEIPVLEWQGVRVVTTETLARGYGTTPIRIQQNYIRNEDHFADGKHFFKISGGELKTFRLSFSESVNKHTTSLILWTERGAARMSKIVDTDEAWAFFEKLEDSYFRQKEQQPIAIPQTLPEALRLAAELAEQKQLLEQKAHQLNQQLVAAAPKVDFADRVSVAKGILIGNFAKVVGLKQNALFAWLRENGILIASGGRKNVPFQQYINAGYFTVKEVVLDDEDGYQIRLTPQLTGKGQQWLTRKLLDAGLLKPVAAE
ncbi:TPA: phage antirepressor KilAC domain-containing protein [Escherichia coli]|uniref:phage antirepressor KilAC domain-containing protein n=42 Tax=Enterobacteriaceae TaxID=543 RepID=UPI00313CBBB0